MRRISKKLASRIVEIETERNVIFFHWVDIIEIDNQGLLTFFFNRKLTPFLLLLKKSGGFTQLLFQIVVNLRGSHTKRIYSLLKQHQNQHKYYRDFTVSDLKKKLGLKETTYPRFSIFKRDVLTKAKKEFEEKKQGGHYKSDLTFDIETFRTGRFVTKVRLHIKPLKYKEKITFRKYMENKCYSDLVYYGISEKQAEQFLNNMRESDVQDILKYYLALLESGQVRNTGGAYLAKLLRDRAAVKSSYEKEQAEYRGVQEKQKELERRRRETAGKKAEGDEKKKKLRLQRRFDSLPGAEQDQLLTEFEQTLDRLMLDCYRKDGVQSVVVRSTFSNFLDEKFKISDKARR